MSVEALITEHLDTWTGTIQQRNATGRGSNKKIELYGIKKLRELILELAVRGKLVPQDAADEPAAVLLERIAAEKARLVAAGEIKKSKVLPPIADNEKPFELPEGWAWCRLGEISSDVHYGYTASAKSNDQGTRLLRITDIQNDQVNWNSVPACDITNQKAKTYLLVNDDILIARTGGTIGKSYLVENLNIPAVFASYLIRVRRIDCVYAAYTKLFLSSQTYWQQLYENAAGTGQPNVNATALKRLVVPFPPAAEQHRIVTKVNELMQLCDQLEQATENHLAAHETLVSCLLDTLIQSQNSDELASNWNTLSEHFDTLFTTEASIDQLKQTILQLAVMGKLVPQDQYDEPASVLLEKVAAEKARLVKEKKIKKQKVLPPIAEDEKPFALPEGWTWCRLGNLFLSFSNGLYKPAKYYNESGIASLRMFNIKDGSITLDGVRRLDASAEEIEQYSLEAGDLLINRVNSKELVGKAAVIPVVEEILLYESMNMRARPLKNLVNSDYINVFMMSTAARKYVFSFAKEAVGQASINQTQVSSILIPLPPLKEQQRVFEQTKHLEGICDQLKTNLTQSHQTQLKLTNTLVEQAL